VGDADNAYEKDALLNQVNDTVVPNADTVKALRAL